jgi:ligand-binding sensor domain-containing protein
MKTFFYFLMCFSFAISNAQIQYKFNHFTTDDGLPSNTIYGITQDLKGNIVLGTDNGLSIFDGNQFKNLNVKDGLINPYIVAVSKDKYNNIWLINYGAKLQKFTKNKIINTNVSSLFCNNIVQLDHKIFIYNSQIRNENLGYSFLEFNDNKGFKSKMSSRIAPPILTQNNQEIKLENDFLEYQNFKIPVPKNVKLIHKVIFRKNDIFILDENFLMIVDFNGFVLNQIKLPQALSLNPVYKFDFIIDNYENCWLNIQNKGIFILKNNVWNSINDNLGINNQVNTNFLYCDKSGKIWIATNENGLYCIPDSSINYIQFNNQENYFNGFANSLDKNNLFVSTRFRLYNYSNNKLDFVVQSKFEVKIENFNDQPIFKLPFTEFPKIDKKLNLFKVSGKQLLKIENNKYFLLSGNSNINIFDKNTNNFKTIATKNNKSEKIKQVVFYKDQYYFNNSQTINIRSFDDNFIYELQDFKFRTNGYIEDFIFIKDTMWVATNNVIYKVLNKKILDSIVQVNDVKIDNIHKIKYINNSVYICAGNGLFKIKKNKNRVLNKHNFLPDNDVLNVTLFKNELLVATKGGLAKIDNYLIEKSSVSPTIEIFYNDIITQKIYLKTKQESLKISLKIQNFNHSKNQIIQYKIDQSGWINSLGTDINFQAFEYGNNNLEFRVKDVNSNWTTNSVVVSRAYPFYMQWGFVLAMIILVSNIVYAIYQYQIKKINEKNQIENIINNKIVELRQNALSAMMNPHFIFNSLNAIQYFVNSNQKEKSSEHLAKLARLVRLFLSQAAEPFISISDEINRLKIYLELEQVRFGNFEFNFNIDNNIDLQNLQIPNMILQPFIENAILHGVSNLKNNDGKIELNFELNKNVLTIEIIDNGFGMNENKSINVSHISKGISIISERIAILQQSFPNKIFSISQENAFVDQLRKGHKVTIIVTILD